MKLNYLHVNEHTGQIKYELGTTELTIQMTQAQLDTFKTLARSIIQESYTTIQEEIAQQFLPAPVTIAAEPPIAEAKEDSVSLPPFDDEIPF